MQRELLAKFRLPDAPGVYFFRKGRRILYIGKAASVRDRVRSYFSSDLARARGESIVAMIREADRVSFQKTGNVLEALILEANLIKRHQPSYNAASKDNKSWNYVVITKESYPRILLVRGRELYSGWKKAEIKHLFGPFPHGAQLHEAMRIVRRIFPFRDSKCVPCKEEKNKNCRPCFNRQIGVCPGVCTGEITREEYAQTIRNVSQLFSGNFKGLKRRLSHEMRLFSEGERFEEAARVRSQIHALDHIRDVSLIKGERRIAIGGPTLSAERAGRIEAYDVAHTAGDETVAVMSVVEDGAPLKAAYRKFKIRTARNNDVAALKEALSRRLNHPEWSLPRVFVVDGGKAQLRATESVLKNVGISIPVVAVTKDEFHRPKGLVGDKKIVAANEKDILLANAEAHRFAITWHRKRLSLRR